MSFKTNRLNWILTFIILLASVVRLIHINFNSPFLDEAIYIVLGRKILEGNLKEVLSSVSWVGGFPFFYPLLSAIAYSLGGILGSRILNVVLGTLSVFLIYHFAKQLKLLANEEGNKIVGLISSAFLATSAIPIAFSRLAIYDILSFTLFLFGLVIWQQAVSNGSARKYFFSAAIFFASFLAKYIVVIFLPFLVVLTFYLEFAKERHLNTLKYFASPLAFLVATYIALNFESLKEFILHQTSKGFQPTSILENFWQYSYLYYLISAGVILLLTKKKQIVILFLASIWPLVVHLATGEGLAVHQHSFLSLVFILPIAGVFLAKIVQKFRGIGVATVSGVVLFNLFLSAPKVRALESFWPNTNSALDHLKNKVSFGDKILAESGDVVTLAIYNSRAEMIGPFVFSYKEKEDKEAYIEAIEDGYFNFIELDGTSFDLETLKVFESVIERNYSLIYDENTIRIWQRK